MYKTEGDASLKEAKALMKQVNVADKQHVVILGASFNPITVGHIAFINLLLRQHTLYDKVCLIPTGQSPLKLSSDYASVAERMEMVRLALDHQIDQSDVRRLRLETLELDNPGPSKTILTLAALILKYQCHERYTLACGYDHLLCFDQWYHWEEFFELCSLAFYPRQGVHIIQAKSVDVLRRLLQVGTRVSIFFSHENEKSTFSRYCADTWGKQYDHLQQQLMLCVDTKATLPESASSAIRAYYHAHGASKVIERPEGVSLEVHDYIVNHACYR